MEGKEEIQVLTGERIEPSGKLPYYEYRREKAKGIVIVTFKASKELVEAIDKCKKKLGYMHRSEIIRAAIKLFLEVNGCHDEPRFTRIHG